MNDIDEEYNYIEVLKSNLDYNNKRIADWKSIKKYPKFTAREKALINALISEIKVNNMHICEIIELKQKK